MPFLGTIKRFLLRIQWQKQYEKSLNDRAEVEQELLDCSRGIKPMPNHKQLRKWAVKLGVPKEWRGE